MIDLVLDTVESFGREFLQGIVRDIKRVIYRKVIHLILVLFGILLLFLGLLLYASYFLPIELLILFLGAVLFFIGMMIK